jgi:hypothetical protein
LFSAGYFCMTCKGMNRRRRRRKCYCKKDLWIHITQLLKKGIK